MRRKSRRLCSGDAVDAAVKGSESKCYGSDGGVDQVLPRLPDELLGQVVMLLTPNLRSLLAFGATCRQWRRVLRNEVISLSLPGEERDAYAAFARFSTSHIRSPRGMPGVRSALAAACPRLHELPQAMWVSAHDAQSAARLLDTWRELRTAHLSSYPAVGPALVRRLPPTLERLVVDTHIGTALAALPLLASAPCVSRLQHLALLGPWLDGSAAGSSIAGYRDGHLVEVGGDEGEYGALVGAGGGGNGVDGEAAATTAAADALAAALSWTGPGGNRTAAQLHLLRALHGAPSLRRLHLARLPMPLSAAAAAAGGRVRTRRTSLPASLATPPQLGLLYHLSLTACSKFTDDDVTLLARGSPRLTELVITDAPHVGSAALATCVQKCWRQLRSVTLINTGGVASDLATALGSLPTLDQLVLGRGHVVRFGPFCVPLDLDPRAAVRMLAADAHAEAVDFFAAGVPIGAGGAGGGAGGAAARGSFWANCSDQGLQLLMCSARKVLLSGVQLPSAALPSAHLAASAAAHAVLGGHPAPVTMAGHPAGGGMVGASPWPRLETLELVVDAGAAAGMDERWSSFAFIVSSLPLLDSLTIKGGRSSLAAAVGGGPRMSAHLVSASLTHLDICSLLLDDGCIDGTLHCCPELRSLRLANLDDVTRIEATHPQLTSLKLALHRLEVLRVRGPSLMEACLTGCCSLEVIEVHAAQGLKLDMPQAEYGGLNFYLEEDHPLRQLRISCPPPEPAAVGGPAPCSSTSPSATAPPRQDAPAAAGGSSPACSSSSRGSSMFQQDDDEDNTAGTAGNGNTATVDWGPPCPCGGCGHLHCFRGLEDLALSGVRLPAGLKVASLPALAHIELHACVVGGDIDVMHCHSLERMIALRCRVGDDADHGDDIGSMRRRWLRRASRQQLPQALRDKSDVSPPAYMSAPMAPGCGTSLSQVGGPRINAYSLLGLRDLQVAVDAGAFDKAAIIDCPALHSLDVCIAAGGSNALQLSTKDCPGLSAGVDGSDSSDDEDVPGGAHAHGGGNGVHQGASSQRSPLGRLHTIRFHTTPRSGGTSGGRAAAARGSGSRAAAAAALSRGAAHRGSGRMHMSAVCECGADMDTPRQVAAHLAKPCARSSRCARVHYMG